MRNSVRSCTFKLHLFNVNSKGKTMDHSGSYLRFGLMITTSAIVSWSARSSSAADAKESTSCS